MELIDSETSVVLGIVCGGQSYMLGQQRSKYTCSEEAFVLVNTDILAQCSYSEDWISTCTQRF